MHELEARDALVRTQQTEGDHKRAQLETSRVASALDKTTAQCTVLQQQLKEAQESATVCMHSARH